MRPDQLEDCRRLEAAFVAACEAEGIAYRERWANPMSLAMVRSLASAIKARNDKDEDLCGVLALIVAQPDCHLEGLDFYQAAMTKAARAREAAKGLESGRKEAA